MKRDMELVRKILLAVEDAPGGRAPLKIILDGYTEDQIGYHAYLLVDAGLATGAEATSWAEAPKYLLRNLTWAGHEFLAAARNDPRWKKVMATLAEKGETVTIGVLQGLLVAAMKSAVGLL